MIDYDQEEEERIRKKYEAYGFKAVRTEIDNYQEPSDYVESLCVAIKFINKGTIDATINGFPLTPGEGVRIRQDYPYFDISKYKLDFEPQLGGVRSVYTIRTVLAFD